MTNEQVAPETKGITVKLLAAVDLGPLHTARNDSGGGDLGRYSQARLSSSPTSNTVRPKTRLNRTRFSRFRLLSRAG